MQFNDVINQINVETGEAVIPGTWGQGRATFGGLVAAMVYKVLASRAAEDQLIRSLAISFVGPAPQGPVKIETQLLRQGKNVSQWSASMLANNEVVLSVLASFGSPRESYVDLDSEEPTSYPQPEELKPFPYIEGLTPEFTQHYDYCWAEGDMPYSNGKKRKMGGWIRSKSESSKLTVEDILGFVDAWPPILLSFLNRPAPGSSLTWTIEFIQPSSTQAVNEWFQYEAIAEHAKDGYGHFSANLYDRRGKLVAISRQSVVVFG